MVKDAMESVYIARLIDQLQFHLKLSMSLVRSSETYL